MKPTKSTIDAIFRWIGWPLMLLAIGGWFTMPVAAQSNEPIIVGCPGGDSNGFALIRAVNQSNDQPGQDTIVLTTNCDYEFLGPYLLGGVTALPGLTGHTVIEGNGATIRRGETDWRFRLLYVEGAGSLTLRNLNLLKGSAAAGEGGGAIFTEPGMSLTLENVTLQENRASTGGAVLAQGQTIVRNSRFVQNQALAADGGGLSANSSLTVSDTLFRSNRAKRDGGGVVINNQARATITASVFISNRAELEDGGGLATDGFLTATNNIFRSNLADRVGGAIYTQNAVNLERNTFSGNHAIQDGSGLYLAQTTFNISALVNNLWADNYSNINRPNQSTLCLLCTSESLGAVIVTYNTLANVGPFQETAIRVGQGAVRATNSIIVNYGVGLENLEALVTTDANLYFGNFISEVGNIPPVETHLHGQNPHFVNPAKGIYALQADSPAIDKASTRYTMPPVDRRGIHRFQGDGPDIGAYEYDQGQIPASHVSEPLCRQGVGDVEELAATIIEANAQTGANRIELAVNCSYTLEAVNDQAFDGPTGLPLVTDYLVIEGNGATLQRKEDVPDFRLLAVDDASLILRDLTLQNGRTLEAGAGLYVNTLSSPGEVLSLTNVTLNGNTSTNDSGGGLMVINSLVTINDSRFEGNRAEEGGGAHIAGAPDLRLSGVSFSGNSADNRGGAVSINGGQGEINRGHFEDNRAVDGDGGGIYLSDALLEVSESTFIKNLASRGGGIYARYEADILSLNGNTFLTNRALDGAGLYLRPAASDNLIVNNLWIDNVTIGDETSAVISLQPPEDDQRGSVDILHNTIANSALAEGSGVTVSGASARLRNNIVTNYRLHWAVGIGLGSNLTAEHNLIFTETATDTGEVDDHNNRIDDPMFVDPISGNFHLRPGSPAIDAGLDAGIIVDLDGLPRPQGEGFDIGVFEADPTAPAPGPNPTPIPTPDPTPDPNPDTTPEPNPSDDFSVFLPLVVK